MRGDRRRVWARTVCCRGAFEARQPQVPPVITRVDHASIYSTLSPSRRSPKIDVSADHESRAFRASCGGDSSAGRADSPSVSSAEFVGRIACLRQRLGARSAGSAGGRTTGAAGGRGGFGCFAELRAPVACLGSSACSAFSPPPRATTFFQSASSLSVRPCSRRRLIGSGWPLRGSCGFDLQATFGRELILHVDLRPLGSPGGRSRIVSLRDPRALVRHAAFAFEQLHSSIVG